MLGGLLALAGSNARSFEPGSEKICEPSADGLSFECREKAGTSTKADRSRPVEHPSATTPTGIPSPPVVAEPAPRAEIPSSGAAASAARKLPNYLRQDVAADNAPPAASVPTASPVPVAASPTPETKPPNPPAQPPQPAQAPTGALAPADAGRVDASAATTVPASTGAQAMPASEVQPVTHISALRGEPAPTSRALPGSAEFRRLPSNHYTLEISKARSAAALEELAATLGDLPDQVYLLKLGSPDGDWFSLVWSDFPSPEAARAARADLPTDAAITSGWPRRIGPLQTELIR
jgi:septal ring-binding cell division protein DamX